MATYHSLRFSGFTAKSVIFDAADNWGGVSIGIRSIDFWKDGAKIDNLLTTNFTASATNEVLPDFDVGNAFHTPASKIGTHVNTCWLTSPSVADQRLICVFNTPTAFDEIVINNFHFNGGGTEHGIQNVKIHISTDTITSTVYDEAISNSDLIFDGVFNQHALLNVQDDQILTL